jgi:hypothetical protein
MRQHADKLNRESFENRLFLNVHYMPLDSNQFPISRKVIR